MSAKKTVRFCTTALLLGVVFALALTGCKPKLLTVNGTVLNDGQPLPVGPTGSILVTLVPDVAPGAEYTTYPGYPDNATGKFTLTEIPPGKYKVAVEQNDPLPGTDKLKGKYSPKNTTIVREVVDEKTPLTIDLAKP
jgi:hypothetical protein